MSSSRRRVCESFLPIKYLTASSLSLIFCSSVVYSFWFRCSPVLTLDLNGIDFLFPSSLSCLFRVVVRMIQWAARVAGVYGKLLECAAMVSCWRCGYDKLLEEAVMASTARHRPASRLVPRQRLAATWTSGSLTMMGSDLGLWQTSAARPQPAATAGGSSSLSTWPTAVSFLDAWIWAWQAWIQVRIFLKN
jgi:hypothetical protein